MRGRTARRVRRGTVLPPPREELLAHHLVRTEAAEHRARHHLGILLLHAAHHHAEVAALEDDAHALGLRRVLDGLGDLFREAFLDLEPPREAVHDARDLRDAEHLALRDVPHRAAAVERQHVVFAQRVDLDVPQHDHVVRARVEDGVAQDAARRLAVAAREKRKRLGDALRRLQEAVAPRILAQFDQQLPHQLGNPLLVRFIRLLAHGRIVYHIVSDRGTAPSPCRRGRRARAPSRRRTPPGTRPCASRPP